MSTGQTTGAPGNRTAQAAESDPPSSKRPRGEARTGTVRTVWLVARRELDTRVRTRAFVIGTLVTLLIVVGYPVVMSLIGGGPGTPTIGVTARSAAVAEPLAKTLGEPVKTRRVPDAESGRALVRDGDVDALVIGGATNLTLVVDGDPDGKLVSALQAVARQRALDSALAEAGLDPGAIRADVRESGVEVTRLDSADPHQGQRLGMAMAAGFLLYFFLIATGQMVAQGVVEEKSSRVVEILLSTIRPTHLLAGKILGTGLTGLLQFVIVGAGGYAAVSVAGVVALPSAALLSTLLWALVWFLLGFLFYATILAAGASLVSRQEDLQGVITPVIMLLIVPFIVGVSVLPGNPDSTVGAVLSLVPGFSPVLMPMRLALGVAAPWEVVVSFALTLLATVAVLWLGGRIYRNAVLRTGARVKITEALRAA